MPLRPCQFGRIVVCLLIALGSVQGIVRAAPDVEKASQERARAGALAHPAAAWHHLLLARSASGPDARAAALTNAQLAVNLDPDLVEGWFIIAKLGFPDANAVSQGLRGAAAAVTRSWEAQRRLLTALLPPLWAATSLAAVILLFGLGLRRISRYAHRLEEEFRPHLSPRRSGWAAVALCALPLMLQWGLAASACIYASLVHHDLGRRERALGVMALLWFFAMPSLWTWIEPSVRPIEPAETAWLIDRVQREVPTPEIESLVRRVAQARPGPESSFMVGMLDRRKGDLHAAAEPFRAASVDSSLVFAHAGVNLGNLRLWQDDAAGAAQQYESVLDAPSARLEARYNLAIALSRLHRFREADERLDEASRLDLARVRAASRTGDPSATFDVMDGLLTSSELWEIERAAIGSPAPIPPIVSWLVPGGRPSAAGPTLILAVALGALVGAFLRRRLRVHDCHHCGAPICRRCVTRGIGHAYCPPCAIILGGYEQRDVDRIMLRRLLGEETQPVERARWWGTYAAPGLGLIARGRPWTGALLAWSFLFGLVLLTRAAWPYAPSPDGAWIELLLRGLGALLVVTSACTSLVVARRVARQRSVRHFFERDTYRAAA
jgi:tetratricopeptide (TPR) repeat protein